MQLFLELNLQGLTRKTGMKLGMQRPGSSSFVPPELNLHVQLSLLLDTVFSSVRCTPLQKYQLYNMQQTGSNSFFLELNLQGLTRKTGMKLGMQRPGSSSFVPLELNLHVQLCLLLDTVFSSVRCTPLQKYQLYNMQQTGSNRFFP